MPKETIRQALSGKWFDWFARIGYAAKGTIWGMVGYLAARVAFGSLREDADFEGAIQALHDQPFNIVLLALLALGLFAYALWRVVQAVFDVEGEGSDAKGWSKRILYLVIGLTYGFLAVYAAGVIGGWSRDEDQIQDFTATILAFQPIGRWVVGLAGVAIIVAGLAELYWAISRGYLSELGTDEIEGFERVTVLSTGGIGHVARGILYSAVGVFAVRAAIEFDPEEARGLGETFQELADQPFGPWIVGFIAVGFISFGIYCLLLAFHRHIPNEGLGTGRS